MKTKNILIIAAIVLFTSMVSCNKDHEISTGTEYEGDTLVTGSDDNHEFIDLDLPSGTLWATCNLGASSPEDYGCYYAWGETTIKKTYTWTSYKYSKGTSLDNPRLTRYCGNSNYGNNGYSDALNTLLPEDDAATINWGKNWCMPTEEQWQELLNNTSIKETVQNGAHGRLFTATNGNTLFLPAAGYRWNNDVLSDVGNKGYYWSSSLCTDSPSEAYLFSFYSNHNGVSETFRIWGRTVRPVRSAKAQLK